MQDQTGVVKRFLQEKNYGFIGRSEGPDIFYHLAATVGEIVPSEGDRVQFTEVATPKGPKAIGVRVVQQ